MRCRLHRQHRCDQPADERQQHDPHDRREHDEPATGMRGVAAHAHDPALDRDNDGIGYRTEPSAERAERRDAARAHQPGAERRQRGDNDDAEHEITHDGENQRHDKVTRV